MYIEEFETNINQQDPINICRMLHPRAEYPFFFKCPWNIYEDRLYILGQKRRLTIFKEIKLYRCVLQPERNQNEVNSRKTAGKSPNNWKLNNTLLNNPWVEEISRDILKIHSME